MLQSWCRYCQYWLEHVESPVITHPGYAYESENKSKQVPRRLLSEVAVSPASFLPEAAVDFSRNNLHEKAQRMASQYNGIS